MTLLTDPDQIWVLEPTQDDLSAAAEYAAITLPWTFNRMMLNTSVRGQLERGLNIAKGIVAQEMLRRSLQERGIDAQTQRKSYRDTDLFDFLVPIDGDYKRLDVKSVNFYNNYQRYGREPLSAELICANVGYFGPDWRQFFPALVPHTQINQNKQMYCFAIADSLDFRRDIDTNRSNYALTTYPYGKLMAFTSSQVLCRAREDAASGFALDIDYRSNSLFSRARDHHLELTILGEWDGQKVVRVVEIKPNQTARGVGPFSCVSAFQLSKATFDSFDGYFEVRVGKNDFSGVVRDSARRNINIIPSETMSFTRGDFCNLFLPDSYQLYVIGWINKPDFLDACREYTGWVWPNDGVNRFHNQPWSQITERDVQSLARAGFESAIQRKPSRVNAGWLKTTGRGGGACCYYFPNIGQNGGVRETNLYALPQDLTIMGELGLD